MMKKIIFVLLSLSQAINAFSEGYLSYYHLCNEADEQIYLKNYSAALDKFELAFQTVSYIHNERYIKASKCAILTNQNTKAYEYICQLKRQGGANDFLMDKTFSSFKTTNFYQLYLDSLSYYENIYNQSLDENYVYLIDSLYFIDQSIVRKSFPDFFKKKKYKIEQSKLPKYKWLLDDTVFASLLELMEEFGFPSAKKVGEKAYFKATIILHHHLRLPKNEIYHPIAVSALERGEYLPFHYEVMYEQYRQNIGKRPFYTTFNQDLSENNLKRLDSNRKKIGLKPIRGYQLKNKGLIMSEKWGKFE